MMAILKVSDYNNSYYSACKILPVKGIIFSLLKSLLNRYLTACLLLFLISIGFGYGANRFAVSTGNWSGSIWASTVGGVPGSAATPTSSDDVTINNGITVTVNSAAVCNTITTTNTGGITISGNNTLNVTGLISMARPSANNTNFTISIGDGVLTAGSLTMSATTTSRNDIITIGTGSLTINGNFTSNGTTGCQLTFLGAGTLEFKGTLTLTGIPNITTFNDCTVKYSASAGQTVINDVYENLTLAGSGSKSITTASVTVNKELLMEGSATASNPPTYSGSSSLRYNTATSRNAGSEWITPFAATGGITIDNTGTITMNANKVLNANVPLTINGNATLSTNNNQLSLGGDFTNGGTFTAGSSPIIISGNAATQNISGFTTTGAVSMTKTGGTATLTGNVNGNSLTTNGNGGKLNLGTGLTHTFTGNWTRTNGTLEGGTSLLKIQGITSATGLFTANTGTVEFTSTATIPALTYYNLTFSGATTKTIATGTTITVTNDWSVGSPTTMTTTAGATISGNISGSGAITAGSGTITVGGDFTNSGIFTCGTSTVNYNGVNQQVKGATYYNLTLSGGGTKTLQAGATVNGILSLSSAILQLGNYNMTIANTIGPSAITGTFGSSNMIETNGTGSLMVSSNTNNNSFNGTYPIGNSSFYDPVIVSGLGSLTAASRTFSIRSVASNPNILSNGLNKYWDISTTNITVGSATISLKYDSSEASGPSQSYLPYNNTSGSWAVATTPSLAGVNPVTSSGSSSFSGWWTAGTVSTFYSYQNGSWSTPTTWTADPSGTTQVGSTIPSSRDNVKILPGRTVTLPGNVTSTNLTVTIDEDGFLDLGIYQFTAGLSLLAGQGTLKIASSYFPVATTNTFINSGGGITEFTAGMTIPAQNVYNHLSINAPSNTIIQTINLTLNGDLHVKAGTFKINDITNQRLQLIVSGNATIDAGASITVGNGVTNTTITPTNISGGTPPFVNYYENQSHRVVFNGDFINNGTVRFTNLNHPVYNAFPPTVLGATSGFATVYFQGSSNNNLLCAGQTDFYNLIVDKGTDQTYKLTLYTSGSYANFRLFGANSAEFDITNTTPANPNLKKALWIRNGTLELQGTTIIPSLSEGTSANTLFTIPSNGALLLNGVDAAVFMTADDYREVNCAYGTSAANNTSMGINQSAGNGFMLYGKLEIDKGYFSTKESEGITTSNVASGQFVLNDGTVDTKQFLSPTGSASYEQYGGTIVLRGRFQRTPSAFLAVTNLINAPINYNRANDALLNSTSGTFCLNNATNVFTMGGGNLIIYDVTAPTGSTYAFQVNSSTSNMNVTGGNVQFIPTNGTGGSANSSTHLITTTAPFGNVVINRASSTSTVQLNTAMTVLNSFSLTSGAFNANGLNLTVGGDILVAAGTNFTTGANTTILNGAGMQTFTIDLASPLSLNNLTINKSAGSIVKMEGSQKSITVAGDFNLNLGTLQDNGDVVSIAKNVFNSGVHNGLGKIVLNGTLAQTIDGDGIFENVELNNTNGVAGSAPVSLIADMAINGVLTLSQNRLFNIGTYNLKLGSASSIVNYSASRYIQTAGNSGDGGVTKTFSSTTNFVFPVGAPSVSHAGVPKWTPATIGFSVAPTTYGTVTVVPVGYEHPSTTKDNQSLTYFWRIKSSGFTGIATNSVLHTFVYDQTDVVGTESNYIPSVYNSNTYTWNNGLAANINTSTNTISDWSSPTNSQNFLDGNYTAGDNTTGGGAFGTATKFYSIASAAWNSYSTWSYTSGGSAVPAGIVEGINFPGPNSIVIIENNKTVNLTATAKCASLQIEAGSVLDIYTWTNSIFGVVLSHPSGNNGLFRLTTSITPNNVPKVFSFPANSDFTEFNNNHGTTEYYDIDGTTGALYILPSNVTTYGNLMVTAKGGDNLVLPNNTLTTIKGDLTCGGDNANAWIAMSWSTNVAPYNSNTYLTVAKTVHVTGDLNVNNGTLIFMDDVAPQNLIVDGNVTVAATANVKANPPTSGYQNIAGAPQANTFTIGGNLTNNTAASYSIGLNNVSDVNGLTYYCDVIFTGSGIASITNTSGNPTTSFHNLTVNKGNSQTSQLKCNIGGTLTTPVNNWLFLQNGTFQYLRNNPANDFTISTTTPFNIPATAGLYVNMPANTNNIRILIANSATSTNDVTLGGKITLVNGNVYVGPVAAPANNNDIEYASAGTPTIQVDGGSLIVNGQIRRNPSITEGSLSYSQNGGTVTINGNSANTTNAKLEVLNNGSSFTMTGGTLNLIRGGGGNLYGDLYLRPATSSVTGGTIVFTNVVPNTAQNYSLDATTPLNNLTITGAAGAGINAKVTLMVNPLTLNGNLELSNARSIFDANTTNNLDLTIKGNLTNNGSYNFYKNLTTFSGGTQSILGSSITNFWDLAIHPVTSLTVGTNSFTVNNNLSISSGTFICGNYNVSVNGNLTNNASYTDNGATYGIILNGTTKQQISGTGTFGQLNLNNPAGAAINNNITLNENLILTSGIFDISQYLLTLSTNSLITASGTAFGPSKMVISDGVWSNVGIKKLISPTPPSSTFTYPLGTPGKYTPTELTITSNTTTGSIRVNNINRNHPAVVDPNNVLDYYWEVESIGLTSFTGKILFNYLPSDVIGGPESSYIAAKLLTPGTNWSKSATGAGNDNVDESGHTITFVLAGLNNLTGEYTAGNDLAIPSTVPQYTSNADGNWSDNTIWTQTGGSSYPCPVGGPNGFVVTVDHVVTANANYSTAYKTIINGKLKLIAPYFGHNLGTVTGNGTLYLENPMFPAGRFSTFLDCSSNGTVEYGGSGNYNIMADLYTSVPNLTFSGTGTRILPNKTLTICQQLLINGPNLDNSTYNRGLFINGTMIRTSGSFNSGSGNNATVTFSGGSSQSVEGFNGTNAFNNLEINNSAGLTLNSSIDVKNKLLLSNGLINTTSSNLLRITNFATSVVFPEGGSSNSYVNGPLSKYLNRGDPGFKFPVGKASSGLGNKLYLRATEASSMYWTVEYFNPNDYPDYIAPLTAINTKEYWKVDCEVAGSQAYVNVGYDPTSDLTPLMTVNGISDLHVAEYDGTNWIKIASVPNAGSDNYNGSVETAALTSLASGSRNYTLGAINGIKPKIKLSPSGPICGTAGIPVTLTTSMAVVAPFVVNYTENGVPKSITPSSFPATIPTLAGGATYVLTSFTYNFPAGNQLTGVVDITSVTAYALPTTANAGPNQSLCGATSANLSGNVPVTGTGLWTILSGSGGTVVDPTSATSVFNGTNGSTYKLRWTITNGTCTSSADVDISFPLLAAQPDNFTTSSAVVCQGSSAVHYTVPNDPSVSYNWSYSGGTGATINGNFNSVTVDFSAAATSGTLNVTATNGCNTSAARSIAITVNLLPTVNTGGAMAAICQGSTSAALGGSFGGGAISAVWSDGGAGGTFTNNGGSSPGLATYTASFTSTSPVTLTLTTSGGNCGTVSASKSIVINQNPTVDVGGAMAAICQGSTSAALGGSFGGGATSAIWSASSGTFANNSGSTPGTTTYTATTNSTSPILLTLTTSGGSCGAVSSSKSIVVHTLSEPPTGITGTNTICFGASTTLTLTGGTAGTGAIAEWFSGACGGTPVGTGSSITVSPSSTTTYYVRYNGTCNTTSCASAIVTVIPTVGTPVFASGAGSNRCQGAGTVTYFATATNNTGVSYALDFTSTSAGNSIVAATGAVTYVAGWSGVSTITVSATGCNGPSTADHLVTTYLPPTATAGTAVSTCSNAGGVNITAGSGSTNSILTTWSSAGTGTFTNPNSLSNCLYTPSVADIAAGSVTLTLTATGNSPCTSATSNKLLTIKMDGTWNGSSGTDWNNGSNWDCGTIPSLTSNVLIGTSKPNYPNNSTAAIDQAGNLTIQNGASLTVTGNTLQIAGSITNNGTFTATSGSIEMIGATPQTIPANTFSSNNIMDLIVNNTAGVTLGGALNISGYVSPVTGTLASGGHLTLLSTVSQTALISGTGTGEVTGTVYMQRYLSSAFGYKYFSSPFSDATVGQFSSWLSSTGTIPNFFLYDEDHRHLGTDMTGWTEYTSGLLSQMVGYAANLGSVGAPATIVLHGNVNNGALSASLDNNNRTYTQGFHLVGNPYPSPINWEASSGWTRTNIDNAIYFFNASGDEYSGSYSTYVNGIQTGSADPIIPAMQGFFVHVSDLPLPYPVHGTLGMTNSVRIDELNPVFKAGTIDTRTILKFTSAFEGADSKPDPLVLYFDPIASFQFDSQADALKLLNTDEKLTNLYAISADQKFLSIDGISYPTDSLTRIPLGVATYRDGYIIFSAKEINQLSTDLDLYLLDNETKNIQDLRQNPNYKFYLSKGTYNQRLSLLFASTKQLLPNIDKDHLFVVSRSGGKTRVFINLELAETGQLTISNVIGQRILDEKVTGQQTIELNSTLSTGIYVVTLKSGQKAYSEKTLIRKE